VTIYDDQLIANRNSSAHNITDMSLRSVDGLTYMHYRGEPLWPFGFGLAYTTWALDIKTTALSTTTTELAMDYKSYYSPLLGSGPATPTLSQNLTLAVTNSGDRTSSVVAHVFGTLVSAPPSDGSLPPAIRQLVGFARAADLYPGETRELQVAIAPLALCRVDSDGNQWAGPGIWRLAATVDGVAMHNATLAVKGAAVPVLEWPSGY
jgi:beta-glucosidase